MIKWQPRPDLRHRQMVITNAYNHGRWPGMLLVDKLAATWACGSTGSKTVWAEVSGAGVDAVPCGRLIE